MRVVAAIICSLGITLFLNGCKDDDTPPNCGCDSETLSTISESRNMIARLTFNSNNSIDPYYENYYWITYFDPDQPWNVLHMIICNDEILGEQFEDVISLPQDEFIEVKISGHLKEICEKRFNPAGVVSKRITLTSIERQ